MSKELENEITLLANVFYGEGEPTGFGCHENEIEQMKKYVESVEPYKPYCVVALWKLWDIQAPIIQSGEHPPVLLVKADHIIEDEKKRFPQGGWVRSTEIKEVYKKCIFRTGSTSYILVGDGTKVAVDLDDANKFF